MKIIEFHEGGSPYGISTLLEWVNGCAHKVELRQEFEMEHSLATLTGTLVHALLEEYFKNGYFETANVEWRGIDFTQIHFTSAELKAFVLFREYRRRYKPNVLGKVLSVEEGFEIKDPEVIGCAPFTGRIDLVVKLNKRDCARIKKMFNVSLTPGIYIVDHKTAGGIYPNTYEAHANSLQATGYMLAYNHVHKTKVKGTLINFMTTARVPKFALIPIPAPGVLARQRLRVVSEAANAAGWPNFQNSRPNSSRCFDYNSVCPHWVNAHCVGA